MKKTSTRLQLTKTTVRVLRDNELSEIRGGDGKPSNNPTGCVAGIYSGPGKEKL